MCTRHERGLLLVAHLDELDLVPLTVECPDDRVDPVPRIAVDPPDAVLMEPREEEISRRLGHPGPPLSRMTTYFSPWRRGSTAPGDSRAIPPVVHERRVTDQGFARVAPVTGPIRLVA